MKVETDADSSSLPTTIKKETLVTAEEEKLSSGSTPATVEAATTKTDNTDIETITVKMEDDIKVRQFIVYVGTSFLLDCRILVSN